MPLCGSSTRRRAIRGWSFGATRIQWASWTSARTDRCSCRVGAGGVRVWALEIDDLLEIARENVTRPLTDEECRQFLHERCPA